jgi:NAD(P)-dependent dehydrogenase (short-subunit alcohol dehydrogenase family)
MTMSDRPDRDSFPRGAVIVGGVGEGLGFALSARFAAAGHRVVMLARSKEHLDSFEARIAAAGGTARGRPTDVRDERQVVAVFEEVVAEYGPLDAAIYNAGAQHRKPLLEITGDTFEKVWRLACFGAFVFGREAVRHMLPRRQGTVIFTGATASLRGGPQFTAFAAAKFGTRAIAQSLAREFGPHGIHVASVVIDGGIDMPEIHRRLAAAGQTAPEDGLLAPGEIAETYYRIHRQHRSAWTMETELRPYSETF